MIDLRPTNKRVACEAPESNQVTAAVRSGFATAAQKNALVPLKVLFGNGGPWNRDQPFYVHDGQIAYVRGEAVVQHQWAKEVFEIAGVKFILVPLDQILVVVQS